MALSLRMPSRIPISRQQQWETPPASCELLSVTCEDVGVLKAVLSVTKFLMSTETHHCLDGQVDLKWVHEEIEDATKKTSPS